MGLQEFALERMLDGELAQRSDIAKQLKAVERQLLLSSVGPDREALEKRKVDLGAKIDEQGRKVGPFLGLVLWEV